MISKMNKEKELIPVAIYQTPKRTILVDRPHFNSSKYECDEQLIRFLRLNVSIWFLELCEKMTKEQLYDVLNEELNNNKNTIYSN